MAIKLTIHSLDKKQCALTGKNGEGITVTFDGEGECFLSWQGFKQLLYFKTSQQSPSRNGLPQPKEEGATK